MAKSIISAQDFNELRLKQAELFVLKQILAEYRQIKDTVLHLEPSPLSSVDDKAFTMQNAIYQQTGLEGLQEKGLIRILDPSSLNGIHLSILYLPLLQGLYTELFESIPASGGGARIIYSKKTGSGMVNGVSFKLNRGSRNRKVFEYLAKRPKKYITKQMLWKIAGEKGRFIEDQDGIIEFNTIITTLRESLKNISPEYLRLKETVILDADITLTD